MKLQIDLKVIAILTLIGLLVVQKCVNDSKTVEEGQTTVIEGKPYTVIKHKVDTLRLWKTKTVIKKGKDIYHDTTIYVKLPAEPIDTLKILKEFYAKKHYIDTLDLGKEIGRVIVSDTISKNSIANRKYDLKVSETYIKDMMIVKENGRNQVYVGPFMSFGGVSFLNSAGVGFMLKTKKDKGYSLNVGLVTQKTLGVSPFIGGGLYWKIKLKK